MIQEVLKYLLETTVFCQAWLNLRPISCKFPVILVRRVLCFMLLKLEFAMILHWIILFSLIFILLHLLIPILLGLFRWKKYTRKAKRPPLRDANAHTCRRFTPWFCQLVSCPNPTIIGTLNTSSWCITMAWKCRWRFKSYFLWILIEWTKPLANVSPASCRCGSALVLGLREWAP